MDEKTKEFMAASKARHICDTSECTKNRLIRAIKDMASENQTQLEWDIRNMSEVAVENLKKELVSLGYIVCNFTACDEDGKEFEDEYTLVVRW